MNSPWRDSDEGIPDPFENALESMERVLADNSERHRLLRARLSEIRERRRAGADLPEIVNKHETPLIVSVVTEMLEALTRAGHDVRVAEAQQLHDQGLTMEEIGTMFGVSRQRVSRLLHH